jgi:hypothetical protein
VSHGDGHNKLCSDRQQPVCAGSANGKATAPGVTTRQHLPSGDSMALPLWIVNRHLLSFIKTCPRQKVSMADRVHGPARLLQEPRAAGLSRASALSLLLCSFVCLYCDRPALTQTADLPKDRTL